MFTQLIVVALVIGGLALEVYSYWFYYTKRDRNLPMALGVFLSTQVVAFVCIGGGIVLFNVAQSVSPEDYGPAVRHRDRGPTTPPTRPDDADIYRHARNAVLEHVFTPSPPRFADAFDVTPHDDKPNVFDVTGSFTTKGFTGEATQRFTARLAFTHNGAFRKTLRVTVNDEAVFEND